MRTLISYSFLICLLVAFLGCQKPTIDPVEEQVTKVIDTSLIVGYWKLTSKPSNYYGLYFRQDHYLKQDNSGVWETDLDGTWGVKSEKIVDIGGVTADIKKLTKDSLIFMVANTLFKHVRISLPTSDYVLSTLARNLSFPSGITGDRNGTVYFNEEIGERISKITGPNNLITAIAGQDPKDYVGLNQLIGFIGRTKSLALEKDGSLITCDEYDKVKRISFVDQSITTIAGRRVGFGLENIPAIESDLENPNSVAVDAEGNIYVAELFNPRIRKIDKATGRINTIIGKVKYDNGMPIFNPNPGTGLNIYLGPISITTDSEGNLYTTDNVFHCIWKYKKDGTIVRMAGNGSLGFSGDGNAATSAQLNMPCGVAVDAVGNIYISDSGNHRIRKVNASDGKISTIAGRGMKGIDNWSNPLQAKLATPTSIYVDEKGNVFFIDSENSQLRKLTLK